MRPISFREQTEIRQPGAPCARASRLAKSECHYCQLDDNRQNMCKSETRTIASAKWRKLRLTDFAVLAVAILLPS